MSPEIVAALIAASVSVIASGVAFIISTRSLRVEREKLDRDQLRFEAEREKWETEIRQGEEQRRVWQAEVEKLQVETEKLSREADEIRRRRLDVERAELTDLLRLFDRAVFDAPMNSEEPVAMFDAIRQTRIGLQTSGATLIRDAEVAYRAQEIRRVLMMTEAKVIEKCPEILEMLDEGPGLPIYRQRSLTSEVLGRQKFWDAVRLMLEMRGEIAIHLRAIRDRLKVLDQMSGDGRESLTR